MAEKDAKVAAETAKEGSDEQSEVGVKKRPVKLFIFIGLIFDNLIRTWVEKRKQHLGIA